MVNVDIPRMVRKNRVRLMLADEDFNRLGNFKDRNRVHAIVWKIAERN